MRQRPAQILAQTRAYLASEGLRLIQAPLELRGAVRQPKRFQLLGPALRVLAHEHEVPVVGHQHQAVAGPIAADLTAVGGEPGVVIGGFDLHHAAFGNLALARLAALHLPGGVEAEVGMARALVGQLDDAEDLGLERTADRVQQVGERAVAGALAGRAAGGAHAAQVFEVGLDCCR